jgi:hypothetical protein
VRKVIKNAAATGMGAAMTATWIVGVAATTATRIAVAAATGEGAGTTMIVMDAVIAEDLVLTSAAAMMIDGAHG